MKKWIVLEAVILVVNIFLYYLVNEPSAAAEPVKQPRENGFELLVQVESELIPFSEVEIVKVEVEDCDTVETSQVSVEDFIYSHRQDIQTQIYEIEPELSDTLILLAHCESSLNPQAVGDNGNSHGLFQIFLKWHPDVTKEQAQDVAFSTRWTADKIRQGKGDLWSCWSKI